MTFGTLPLQSGTLDLDAGEVCRTDGTTRSLTEQELKLLRYLCARAGELVPFDEIYAEVLGYAAGVVSRALDKAVYRLRRKIEPEGCKPVHLVRVKKSGLIFSPAHNAAPEPLDAALEPPGDAFFGRQPDISALNAALSAPSGVISVVGPGGIGKTRLIREVLRRVVQARVVWVDLTAAEDEAAVVRTLSQALGVSEQQLARVLPTLPETTLIALDNAEQVSESVGRLLLGWRATARLRWLVTSRRVLRVREERVIRLGPLQPDAAAALLQDRAGARAAGWGARAQDAAHVQQITQELEGWPLAIELAAGHAAMFSPRSMQRHLSALLTAAVEGYPERQASLVKTLRWSWSLLDAACQAALVALSSVRGSVSIETVLALLGPAGLPVFARLHDHSLVAPFDYDGDQPRFSLLEAVRGFAARQGAAGAAAAARRALAVHMAERYGSDAVLRALAQRHHRHNELRFQFTEDMENVRRAIPVLLAAGEAEAGLWLARVLLEWLLMRHWYRRVVATSTEILAADVGGAASQRSAVRLLHAVGLLYSGEATGAQAMKDLAAELEACGDTHIASDVHYMLLDWSLRQMDGPAGEHAAAEALRLAYLAAPPKRNLQAIRRIEQLRGAWLVGFTASEPEGRALLEMVLRFSRQQGLALQEAFCLMSLATAASTRQAYDEAAQLCQQAQSLLTAHQHRWPGVSMRLGWVRYQQGRLEEARALLIRAQEWALPTGSPELPLIRTYLSGVLWDLGQTEEAAELLYLAGASLDRRPALRIRMSWLLERARQATTDGERRRHAAAALALLPPGLPLPARLQRVLDGLSGSEQPP